MKLSSIFLIAAVLTGIAGSAIAAPGPLHWHARALEQVNSFQHEVDGEPDLFKRVYSYPRQPHHIIAGQTLAWSADANLEAAIEAHKTSQGPSTLRTRKQWEEQRDIHFLISKIHRDQSAAHFAAASAPTRSKPLHLHDDMKAAHEGYSAAMLTKIYAEIDRTAVKAKL